MANVDTNTLCSEPDINMFEFLIDNIFAMFGGRVFQQTIRIPYTYEYKLCSSSPRLVPLFV